MSKFYIKNHGVFYTTSSGVEKKVMSKLPDPWAIYYSEFENNLSGWSDQEVVNELVLLLSEEQQNEFKKIMACHHAYNHLERFGASEDELQRFWSFCIDQNAPIERSEGSEVKKGGDWVGGDEKDSFLPEQGFARAKFREKFERLEWIEYRIEGKLIAVLYYENLGRRRYVLLPEEDVKIRFKNFLIKKNKIEKLTSKIAEKNLLLLDDSERNSEYYLEKLFAWQDEFDWVDWEKFKDSWAYCEQCKGYSEGSCICYAR